MMTIYIIIFEVIPGKKILASFIDHQHAYFVVTEKWPWYEFLRCSKVGPVMVLVVSHVK